LSQLPGFTGENIKGRMSGPFLWLTLSAELGQDTRWVQFRRAPAGIYSETESMKKYYVVTGVDRENGAREILNGFYSRADALEEADCHRHTHKKIVVQVIMDTPAAYTDLVQQLQREAA
jgi:hypothetical protein